MTDPIQIVIGNLAPDGLTLTVLGRCHPGAADYWDGNWIRTAIDARAGSFSAHVTADLRSEELQDFKAQLVELSRTLTGTANFETMEGWLALTFEVDALGHIEVRGKLLDEPGVGNVLTFSLRLDQSYLRPIIASLSDVDRAWPVVGTP